jgi:hypothetical protein
MDADRLNTVAGSPLHMREWVWSVPANEKFILDSGFIHPKQMNAHPKRMNALCDIDGEHISN